MDASKTNARGAARAQWFSELNKAIDEAQWLAWRIGVVEGRNEQALELYVRLEMLRAEVDAIRPRQVSSRESDSAGNLTASGEGLEE